MALLLTGSGACDPPRQPRLLHLDAPSQAHPATAGCAHAAFELPLGAGGLVRADGVRLLAWDGGHGGPYALGQMLQQAASSRWDMPAASRGGADAETHVVLHLDCSGRPSGSGTVWDDLRTRTEQALRARRRAAQHMRRSTGASWSEHDLDCLWGTLEALRRGPFLYDDLEITAEEETRLRDAAAVDGGVWVCRVARSTHQGQLVCLDRRLRLLAVARYLLGE